MTTTVKVQDTSSSSKMWFNCEVYEIDYYNIKCLLEPFYGPIIDACNAGKSVTLQLDFMNEENKYIATSFDTDYKITVSCDHRPEVSSVSRFTDGTKKLRFSGEIHAMLSVKFLFFKMSDVLFQPLVGHSQMIKFRKRFFGFGPC